MNHSHLGASAIEVPAICLGTMTFGEQVDEPVAHRILDRSIERGIPFLFATGYGDGLDLPDRFSDVILLKKPYSGATLAQAIAPMLARG